jgi:hypothetical protein
MYLLNINQIFLDFPTCVKLRWKQIRIQIGIKMDNRIRIGISRIPIRNTLVTKVVFTLKDPGP